MATNFGGGFFCDSDMTRNFRRATGIERVRNHVFHLFTTDQILAPPGSKDSDFGYDVRRLLGSSQPVPAIQARLSGIAQKDPRVRTCTVRITETQTTGDDAEWRVEIDCTTSEGPFRMVLGVNQLTVAILEAQ